MSTIELTKETFEDTVTQPGITLVDWWAEWCGPCKQFGPVFQAASDDHPDVRFGKIDTEDQQELAAAARITSIPTLMAFRDGILVFLPPGRPAGPRPGAGHQGRPGPGHGRGPGRGGQAVGRSARRRRPVSTPAS